MSDIQINITENKFRFEELLRRITREGAAIPSLLYKLEQSDFYFAPCSTKFHLNVHGGLCQHSLNVYDNLVKLNHEFNCGFDEESMIIVALLHDIDKMNKYEETTFNKKLYHECGKKSDEKGKFDWIAETGFIIKDTDDRFVLGHHGQNSEYIIQGYIPLKLEESVAIVNHMGNAYDEYKPFDITAIYRRYPLAQFLYISDFLSTFYTEANQIKK